MLPYPYPPRDAPAEWESEDEEQEDDRPPAEFSSLARAVLPTVGQRAIMAAWDHSRPIPYDRTAAWDPDCQRVQAAVNHILDSQPPTPPRQAPIPPPPPPPPAPVLARVPTPPARLPPAIKFGAPMNAPVYFAPPLPPPIPPPIPQFAPYKPAPAPPIEIDLDNDPDPFYVRAAPIAGPAPKAAAKARAVHRNRINNNNNRNSNVISIDSSDDEDDDEPLVFMDQGKGKGKAVPAPPPPPEEPQPEINMDLEAAHADYASAEQTLMDVALAQVISVVPDVLPSHALALLQNAEAQGHKPGAGGAEVVLEQLFSGEYPKVEHGADRKGKGKKRERSVELLEKDDDERDWLDTKGRERLGKAYEEAALEALYATYDRVSKSDVRKTFASSGSFFAPAFDAIQLASDAGTLKLLGSARVSGKGKTREVVCVELEKERGWVLKRARKAQEEKDAVVRREKEAEAEIERGEFFECGCCFTDIGFSLLVQCTEGHSFCQDCVLGLVNSQIGLRKYILPCMSTEGEACKAVYPESETSKFLPATTQAALHKLKQEKELDAAEIEGLAKCPFCPYAQIIDNPNERLFICAREDCGKTTCLQCKKEDHLPKSCAEMDLDKKIDGIHKVEEAMSQALIRKCPKCSEPYIKEDGCNKITCPSCRTVSCYICSKIVKGYEHFANAGSNATYTEPGATCPLWDNQAERNFKEIEAARMAQAAVVAAENPAVVADDLKALNLAPPPPAAGPRYAPQPAYRLQQPPPAVPVDAAAQRAYLLQHAEAQAAQARMRERIEADHRERVRIAQEQNAAAAQRARVAMAEERRKRKEADDAKAAKRERLRRK